MKKGFTMVEVIVIVAIVLIILVVSVVIWNRISGGGIKEIIRCPYDCVPQNECYTVFSIGDMYCQKNYPSAEGKPISVCCREK